MITPCNPVTIGWKETWFPQASRNYNNMPYASAKRRRAFSQQAPPQKFQRLGYGSRYDKYMQRRPTPTASAIKAYNLAVNEKKYFDTAMILDIGAGIGNVTMFEDMTSVPQGDGESARVGRVMRIHALHFDGFVRLKNVISTFQTFSDRYRFILYIDRQNNATAHTAVDQSSDLLQDTGTNLKAVTSYRNLSNIKRFQVLRDWNMVIEPKIIQSTWNGTQTLQHTMMHQKDLSFHKEFKTPLIVHYKSGSTTGVPDTVTENQIRLMAFRENTASGFGAATDCQILGNWRIRFTD